MKNDSVFINQILASIQKIHSFTEGFDKNAFLANQKTQSAVMMQLLLIGELSKKISEETKNRIDLPWKDIAGFRDRGIHDYFEMDLDIVWETIQSDIPVLENAMQKYVQSH